MEYILLFADNVCTDIDFEMHPALESAQSSMQHWYEDAKNSAGENSKCEMDEMSASVYEKDTGNLYYCRIKEIGA